MLLNASIFMYLAAGAGPPEVRKRATHGAATNERHGTEGFKQKSERSCGAFPVVCAIAPACLFLCQVAETPAHRVGIGPTRANRDKMRLTRARKTDLGGDLWQL